MVIDQGRTFNKLLGGGGGGVQTILYSIQLVAAEQVLFWGD
jgi:hypothetical protein